ncbi:unnamed protein product [Taenia asiatica]|uniref:Neural proliferation differentiation and control protein 1-like n=1 Tax=Taenia asiatica TaxID=60517 RepID=A0A0R3WDH1_TAEAS|nr:unnamed protein product [Taenia asiatica]
MVRPVVRQFLVFVALLLTSSLSLSHRSSGYFTSEDEIGIYPFDESETEDDFPFGDVSEGHFLNKWSLSAESDGNANFKSPPSMMDTFEKFKRQAVKCEPSSSYFPSVFLTKWHCCSTMTLESPFTLYLHRAAFGERRDSSEGGKKSEIVGGRSHAGDRSLAHSAQMYHYQQQKQQMLAMEQAAGKTRSSDSNSDSEGEGEEPDVNVYECPGLATVGQTFTLKFI